MLDLASWLLPLKSATAAAVAYHGQGARPSWKKGLNVVKATLRAPKSKTTNLTNEGHKRHSWIPRNGATNQQHNKWREAKQGCDDGRTNTSEVSEGMPLAMQKTLPKTRK